MLEKPGQELAVGQTAGASVKLLSAAAKGDLDAPAVVAENPLGADCHAKGVAAQVGQGPVGAFAGTLDKHPPAVEASPANKAGGLLAGQSEHRFVGLQQRVKPFQHQLAESAAEGFDRRQPSVVGGELNPLPVAAVARRAKDHVQVGMELELAAPGVEHREHPEFYPRKARVPGADLFDGSSDGLEEGVVACLAAELKENPQRLGNREHAVVGGGIGDLPPPLGHPAHRGASLADGAMAVAAACGKGFPMPARAAAFKIAQLSASASRERPARLLLVEAEPALLPVPRQCLLDDGRDHCPPLLSLTPV